MHYSRFFAMIATSTIVMFGLMYLNTYALDHLFFSETRAYMAVVMGAVMALVMLGFMWAMYDGRGKKIGILAGAAVVFALALFLVRSQVTVGGTSYMSAMIPHHSIAVMTSERAGIEDARARTLADGIIRAQRREIAEMRYLIDDINAGNVAEAVYQDPPAQTGTTADALSQLLLTTLFPDTVKEEEAAEALGAAGACAFRETPAGVPLLWTNQAGDSATMKLNGIILTLTGSDGSWSEGRASAEVTSLEDRAGMREDSRMVFRLEDGPTRGYHGFWSCGE